MCGPPLKTEVAERPFSRINQPDLALLAEDCHRRFQRGSINLLSFTGGFVRPLAAARLRRLSSPPAKHLDALPGLNKSVHRRFRAFTPLSFCSIRPMGVRFQRRAFRKARSVVYSYHISLKNKCGETPRRAMQAKFESPVGR